MLLHIFGDTHGPDEIFKINPKKFLDRDLTKDDAIVVCGDFGLPFFPTDRIPANELKAKNYPQHNIKSARAYKMYTDWLASFPCDILFVDGNHDNHAFWAEQPTEQWNGGLIQRLPEASNVIHLMRGEYYTIDGMTVWCMGGAESIDKIYRTEGVTWWREEIPSMKETWLRHTGGARKQSRHYSYAHAATDAYADILSGHQPYQRPNWGISQRNLPQSGVQAVVLWAYAQRCRQADVQAQSAV